MLLRVFMWPYDSKVGCLVMQLCLYTCLCIRLRFRQTDTLTHHSTSKAKQTKRNDAHGRGHIHSDNQTHLDRPHSCFPNIRAFHGSDHSQRATHLRCNNKIHRVRLIATIGYTKRNIRLNKQFKRESIDAPVKSIFSTIGLRLIVIITQNKVMIYHK